MKYIDADKLIAEIEYLRGKYPSWQLKLAMDDFKEFILSLQQEQPEAELKEYISNKLRELGADLIHHKPYSFNLGLNVGKTNAYHDILDRLTVRKEE